MVNGTEVLNDAQFENELQAMKNKGELDEFTARQVYQMRKQCVVCQSNGYSKKQSNIAITVTAAVNAMLAFLFARFTGGGVS